MSTGGSGVVSVRLAAGFRRQLEEIERFLHEAEAPQAFNALLDELLDVVVPNLERFPGIGRLFLERAPTSVEAFHAAQRVRDQLQALAPGAELREYVLTQHLLLYARVGEVVHLLAIRHQRQLSFDFEGLWARPG